QLTPFVTSPTVVLDELRIVMTTKTRGGPEYYTVGQLEQFMAKHMVGKETFLPLLRPAFHRVRDALCDTLHRSHRSVRPSTRLETLFPQRERADFWKAFFNKLGIPAEPLEFPYRFRWT